MKRNLFTTGLLLASMTLPTAICASSPIELEGEVSIVNPEALKYNYMLQFPGLQLNFSDPRFSDLVPGEDFYVYFDNYGAGPTTMHVCGIGDYEGELTTEVNILKGDITTDLFTISTPDENNDTYNGYRHNATYSSYDLYGGIITYVTSDIDSSGNPAGTPPEGFIYNPETDEYYNPDTGEIYFPEITTFDDPIYPATYEIWIEFPETANYHALPRTKVGEMTIHPVNADQIAQLTEMEPTLKKKGFKGFNWSTYYDERNAFRYSSHLTFKSGRIASINLDSYFNEVTDGGGGTIGGDGGSTDIESVNVSEDASTNQSKGVPFPAELLEIESLERLSLCRDYISSDAGEIASLINASETRKSVASRLNALHLPENNITGDISVFGQTFPSLHTLDLSKNRLTDVSTFLSSGLSLYFGDQRTDGVIGIDLTRADLTSLMPQIPSLAFYDHYYQRICPYLNVTISDDENFSGNFGMQMTVNDVTGNPYIQRLQNYGKGLYKGPLENQLYVSFGSVYSGSSGIGMKASVKMLPHDLNFDMNVNVADLQSIANYILTQSEYTLFNFTSADMNSDEKVNAVDLVRFINLMFSMTPQTFADASGGLKRIPGAEGLQETPSTARLYLENGNLYLETDTEIAAIDIAVDAGTAPCWADSSSLSGLTATTRSVGDRHRLLAYSADGSALSAGVHLLATGVEGTPTGGSLAAPDARQIHLRFDTTTGITDISTERLGATAKGGEILVTAPEKGNWTLTDISGVQLGSGSFDEGATVLPTAKPDSRPVILRLATESDTVTVKL